MRDIKFTCNAVPDLVSIVIPTYHKDRYIADTLASVGSQTYPHWELIVVEDSSRGATEQIVADFARQHPQRRIEYSRNDCNRGAAHSRNVAFAQARGEFVAMIDADDRWYPGHLASSVEQLRSSGKDLVYSSVLMIEDQTDLLLGVCGPTAKELREFPASLFGRNFVTPSATVMRRDVLRDVGAWNTAMKYCEDQEFWMRCLCAGKQFHLVGGCHCLYRKNHEGATTQRESGANEEFAEIVERFLSMPGTRKSRVRSHVAKAFRRAARCHAKNDPARDSSADAAQAASLMSKAWRMQPRRVDYLLEMVRYAVANRFRRSIPPAAPLATESKPMRAAA